MTRRARAQQGGHEKLFLIFHDAYHTESTDAVGPTRKSPVAYVLLLVIMFQGNFESFKNIFEKARAPYVSQW